MEKPENVFDIKTRQPYTESLEMKEANEKAVAESLAALEEAQRADGYQEHLATCQALLDLAQKGDLEGLVIVAWHKPTQLFYTEIVFPDGTVPPQEAFKFTGALSLIVDEFKEFSAMAPTVMSNGTISDPKTDYVEDDDSEEDAE